MKQTYRLITTLMIVALLQNCNDNSLIDTIEPNAIPQIDLSIGNEWSYKLTVFGFDGNILRYTNFYTKVLRDTFIQGDVYSLISEDTLYTSKKITSIVKEQTGGYVKRIKYQYGPNNTDIRDTNIILFKYPALLNDRYLIDPNYSTVFNKVIFDTIRISSLNTVVTVPAGRFTCYKYEEIRNYYEKDSLNNIIAVPNFLTVYYVSDKGIVKQELYFPNTANGIPFLAGYSELNNITLHKR